MKKFLKILLIVIGVLLAICLVCTVLNKINASRIEGYINSIEPVNFEGQLTPELDEYGSYYFTTDGDFKVMHLTDLHFCGGFISAKNDKKAIGAVAAMVTTEKPDLVIVTGDISFAVPWYGTLNNKYAHGYAKQLFEKLGVYWTVSFGNHDSESYNFYSRADVADMYSDKELKYCLFDAGPEDVFGECNHVINVKNSRGLITESFVVIDTNAYTEDDVLGIGWSYDRIRDDQIEWYSEMIERYTEYNQSIYYSLPEAERLDSDKELLHLNSMMFMHIPIKEVRDAYWEYVNNNRQNTEDVTYIEGHDGESDTVVYCSEEDEEMFETILELGSTKALFYGHDHLNNFVLEYKGVTLSYGYSVDYSAYAGIAKRGYQRGCSLITCKDDGSFTILHENYYQDKYKPIYEKEVVDMSK